MVRVPWCPTRLYSTSAEDVYKRRVLGFILNCPAYDDYHALEAAIYPLVVQAANMDKLASHLKHNKYPAYIHSRAIEQ